MSHLTELHAAALASDAAADWAAFYQALAGTSLVVPLAEQAGETAKPLLADHGGMAAVQAFPDMDSFANGLDAPGAYAELAGADLAGLLQGRKTPLLIRERPELLLAPDQLDWIAATYGAEVTRATGAGVTVATPEAPELALIEALGQTVGALGADCPEAWLVEMAAMEETPELVLVLGLADGVRKMEAQIAETVTRAIQAVSARPFAVACPDRGAPLMHSARQHSLG